MYDALLLFCFLFCILYVDLLDLNEVISFSDSRIQ